MGTGTERGKKEEHLLQRGVLGGNVDWARQCPTQRLATGMLLPKIARVDIIHSKGQLCINAQQMHLNN